MRLVAKGDRGPEHRGQGGAGRLVLEWHSVSTQVSDIARHYQTVHYERIHS